jgi:hypothetical protein
VANATAPHLKIDVELKLEPPTVIVKVRDPATAESGVRLAIVGCWRTITIEPIDVDEFPIKPVAANASPRTPRTNAKAAEIITNNCLCEFELRMSYPLRRVQLLLSPQSRANILRRARKTAFAKATQRGDYICSANLRNRQESRGLKITFV